MAYHQCGFFHASSRHLILCNLQPHFEQLKCFSPAWVISCFLKTSSFEHLLVQFKQPNGLSLLWVVLCLFKKPDVELLQSHWQQLNGLSSLWVVFCLFKCPDVVFLVTLGATICHCCGFFHACSNDLIQSLCGYTLGQLKGFSLVQVLSWLSKSLNVRRLSSHWEQLNGLSTVWVLSCFLKTCILMHLYPHWKQLNGLPPGVNSFMFLQMT